MKVKVVFSRSLKIKYKFIQWQLDWVDFSGLKVSV